MKVQVSKIHLDTSSYERWAETWIAKTWDNLPWYKQHSDQANWLADSIAGDLPGDRMGQATVIAFIVGSVFFPILREQAKSTWGNDTLIKALTGEDELPGNVEPHRDSNPVWAIDDTIIAQMKDHPYPPIGEGRLAAKAEEVGTPKNLTDAYFQADAALDVLEPMLKDSSMPIAKDSLLSELADRMQAIATQIKGKITY